MELQIPINIDNNYLVLAILIFCILCVAFFSSSEAALISVNRIRIRNLVEKGNKNAMAVERVVSKHDRLFATILTTENMFIILASSLASVLAVSIMGEKGIAISSILMTVLIVIFGEITPKTYAAQNAVKVSLIVARPIEKIIYLLSPVISLFAYVSRAIIRSLGVSPTVNPYLLTEDEIRMVLSDGEKEGVLEKSEKKMIEGIFDFGDTIAQEIMVPRVDMSSISHEENIEKAIEIINKTGHSRIPVYEGSVDHIIGILYAKDILKHISEKNYENRIQSIMRPCHYAPASQNVMNLLSDLRNRKISIAIIIDEFGGTAGMVTIETILEEIVGDIEDEFDINLPNYRKIKENEYIVDAKMTIYDLKEKLGISLPEGDYQTVGGFVINLVENIPSLGDKVEFEDFEFIIEKTEAYKLSKIRIKKISKQTKK